MTMAGTGTAAGQPSAIDEDAMSPPEFLRRWTDANGQVWEEVPCPPDPLRNVSDATLGAALGVVLLVPGIALLVAHLFWGLPEWLAPVAGGLVMFGMACLMRSLNEDA